MRIDWKAYNTKGFFDELIDGQGNVRLHGQKLAQFFANLSADELKKARAVADLAIKEMGITFTVYNEGSMIDRAWPFDIIPRTIGKNEWQKVELGLKQRVEALNLFIDDLYHDQKIIKDGVFPRGLLEKSVNFRQQCVGINPPNKIWAHICGSDLVRDGKGTVYVLEDNLRVPSGVSYMLENRSVMKRVFPELFEQMSILPIDDYPSQLFDMLAAMSPRPQDKPEVVVLTPGVFNSAYFEHCYLAQEMGCELVEGRDLVVEKDDCVYMRTITGLQRVDVIYRRIDDLFLDPEVFLPDSQLGVPGLMRAWSKGNVALVNAPGAGVADDKVVYAYVPEIIKYYLDETPKLENVPTYKCLDEKECDYVIKNIDKLVVKPANESGGYGLLIGPKSTQKEQQICIEQIKVDPRNWVAQPTLNLSTVPTFDGLEPDGRHVDLRPFILSSGKDIQVTTGGLTRVAMNKGSLVVNSSQGGGSKDTWIVDEEAE
ncbi:MULTISPECIES: circularly permuted type 2 ATP-grasp protein [Shewanella]|uniref:Circularly permuted type 2 ATP-grasp protein n=1 Tax=Shewanella metallivivens TaxID=2872342 RepID=A0ABT5TKK9_9GAMM|nr:circularly permuted type 2 ATP-grasp protein [Shewanella metallivivens]MDD8058245.1 circularly permuted type 2 ATP-grasp protein [Shewanella metallivivens]